MQQYLIFSSFLFLTVITTFSLAGPVDIESEDVHARSLRTRRDLEGVFDSIANGFSGLVAGAKKVSDSVSKAFNDIFSTSNSNAISDGFAMFANGIKDGFVGIFGVGGSKVKNGFNKIGDKAKAAWEGKANNDGKNTAPAAGKGDAPDGQVPQEETT